MKVAVAVAVAFGVAVAVAVAVKVRVGVALAVNVAVRVGVIVGVSVRVAVGGGGTSSKLTARTLAASGTERNRCPSPSMVSPMTRLIPAAKALPPSPESRLAPVPATVVMIPVAMSTRRIR